MAGKYHVRSISLPSISHPCTLRLEEELNKLRIWEATSTSTSESISHGLVGLDDLYNCMDDLLKMTSTQQVLSQHQREKYVKELLDGSVRLLDICGITREATVQIREHVQALQSALDLDHPLSVVIRALRQVCAMDVSIFQSLLLFWATPVSKPKPKLTGWSLVSKMMHKGAIACEEKQEKVNQMQDVDAAVGTLRRDASSKESDTEKTQSAHRRLKDLVISIEDLENGLECVFRRLIKTRASLLNIISR